LLNLHIFFLKIIIILNIGQVQDLPFLFLNLDFYKIFKITVIKNLVNLFNLIEILVQTNSLLRFFARKDGATVSFCRDA